RCRRWCRPGHRAHGWTPFRPWARTRTPYWPNWVATPTRSPGCARRARPEGQPHGAPRSAPLPKRSDSEQLLRLAQRAHRLAVFAFLVEALAIGAQPLDLVHLGG